MAFEDGIQQVAIENYSHFDTTWKKYVPVIKKKDYYIQQGISMGGDAPKEFVRLYEYGKTRRKNRGKWEAYIAKVGHKWYPVESITEHLMNRAGEILGMRMASSRLAILGNQLFFMSKYFFDPKKYELVHGVDVYAGHLLDRDLVEEIEAKAMSRNFFTFQFTCEAIESVFQEQSEAIIEDFTRLLIFDAIVGNNDRHFYNWAILRHIENSHPPFFRLYSIQLGDCFGTRARVK